MSKLGFIGLGIMGAPMAGHLIAAGCDVALQTRSGVPAELIEAGRVRKRKKKPSKAHREAYGHTPLSADEKLPWGGKRLIVGTGIPAIRLLQKLQDHPEIVANTQALFNQDMDSATFTAHSFVASGQLSGLHPGTLTYHPTEKRIVLAPVMDFLPGERVSGTLTGDIETSGGQAIDGFTWRFSAATEGNAVSATLGLQEGPPRALRRRMTSSPPCPKVTRAMSASAA